MRRRSYSSLGRRKMRRVLAVLVLILLGASLAGRGYAAQSVAGQSGAVDLNADRDCRETAQYWATDLRMGTNAIAVLSGCRQDRSGTWFLPTGPNDPRLPEPILTPEEEQQTAALRAQIEAQLSRPDFGAMMPSWMPAQLDRLMGPPPIVKRPITGWRDPDVMLGNLPSQYAPFLDAFLQDPNRLALRNYARWWYDRRTAAAPLAACDNLNPVACQVVRDQLGIGARPWPWDLEDPFTLAEYLDWALANGVVSVSPIMAPTPIPTSTATVPSTAACPELGAWLEATIQRYRSAIVAIEAVGLYPFPDPEAVAQFGRNAAELERLAAEQDASIAPAAGLALQAVLIQALETYQDSFEVLTEAYRTGDQATSVEGWALRQEAQDYWGEAGRLLQDLEAECRAEGQPATPSSSVPTTSQTAGIAGATYTSPQFGYVVTWQSPWTPSTATSDPEAGDYLRLSTGDVTMEYYAFSTDQPVEQALEAFVAERARTHPGATPRYQAPGGGLNADSPPLWSFTYTKADGVVMGETTTAFSMGSGEAVLMRTVSRPENDESPRSLFYAVSLFLDPVEATAAAR